MDTELAALASTGATTLVALMVSDAWAQVRDRIAGFFGRHEEPAAVEEDLRVSAAELASARQDGDAALAADVAAVWRTRLRRVLRSDPSAADELRQLLAELGAAVEQPGDGVRNSISGGVQNGPVFQGRDFTNLTFHSSVPDVPETDADPA